MKILDVTTEVNSYSVQLNQEAIKSVAKHGIMPLSNLKGKNTGIFGTNVTGLVCVNYLDLNKKSDKIVDAALRTALWEEYTGVFGVTTERSYPFISPENQSIMFEQIQQRIMANLVFVLKPPIIKLAQTASLVGNISSTRALDVCYTVEDCGAQAQGELLISQKGTSAEVCELKTPKEFKLKDILAVLVPVEYYDFAKSTFKDLNVVKVDYTTAQFNKIPQIIEIMFKQKLAAPVDVKVPDYEKALRANILPKYKAFSLHALRLATPYDIAIRFVENIAVNKATLVNLKAKVVSENTNGSGWCLYHNGRTYLPIGADEAKQGWYSKDPVKLGLIPDVKNLSTQYTQKRMLLTKALSDEFLIGADRLGIYMLQNAGFLSLSVPTKLTVEKDLTQHITNTGAAVKKAVNTLQAWWRSKKQPNKVLAVQQLECSLGQVSLDDETAYNSTTDTNLKILQYRN